jgi:catalase
VNRGERRRNKESEKRASSSQHSNVSRLFWNSLDPIEQQHIIDAAIFELGRVRTPARIA